MMNHELRETKDANMRLFEITEHNHLMFPLGIDRDGCAIDLKGKTLKQVFTELLPDMGVPDETEPAPEQKPGSKPSVAKVVETPKSIAQQRWQEICWQAGMPGNEEVRLDVAKP